MKTYAESRTKRIVLWCLALGILIPACIGFATKIFQFVRTLRGEGGAAFTLVPLANYFLATLGFACLMIWAIYHGMFRDIEKPKYTMLEREEELERREAKEKEGRHD